MKKHFLSTPLVIATMAFAIVAFLFLIDSSINQGVSSSNPFSYRHNKNSAVACTLEAKQCPDGSYVGRSGPKCEFAKCPTSPNNLNVNQSTNTNSVNETIPGWETYTNTNYGFSLQYPKTLGTLKSVGNETGYRGISIASTDGTEGTMSITVLEKKYDPKNIEGMYGPVEAQYINEVMFGTHSGSMFMQGDAGCGAQEALTSLEATTTLWISFQDCIDDINANSDQALFYNDRELIRAILLTVRFIE